MNIEIRKFFKELLVNSLEPPQVNYLGENIDNRFNIYTVSGYSSSTPIPRKTAVDVLMNYFKTDDDIVRLFTFMLQNDGTRFYNAKLNIWGKNDFINILERYKWIYDPNLTLFFLDPFYEHEINFLNKIRIIDFRQEVPVKNIVKQIEKACSKMRIQDLDWRITMRLYDLDSQTGELIRKIIGMLLSCQNMQMATHELYVCLKELAINASKANYKLLFEKFETQRQGITPDKDYAHFLRLFKAEIEEHGNKRLFELARQKDKYINIIFQSTADAISLWVTNNTNISLIEKQQIIKKLKKDENQYSMAVEDEGEYTEGAGFGLTLILSILKKYSNDPEPLKVVFYPDFIKIGFELSRSEVLSINAENIKPA